jgi:hypothetical protein
MGASTKTVVEDGVIVRYHPAVRTISRMSSTRKELLLLLKKKLLAGQCIQDIAKETGLGKSRLYHEMYYLKKLGWLPSDFKNPFSVWYTSPLELLKELERDGEKD